LTPITEMSVVELATAIRTQALTSLEVVNAHIDRIEQVNPLINAVIAPRFKQARLEAAAADKRIAIGEDNLPPLLGVPCTMKEFIAVKGQPHTGGLHARRKVIASEDAVLVERLKAAGVIILGSTNGPEGGLWMETYNTLYGRTNNPWNVKHTPGGSSGGEGAIVSCGGSPFGIGSDVGGSIRIPAAFCGVVGHKPTGAMVPTHGHQPPGHVGDYLVAGPLTRTVGDIWPILSVIAGPTEKDPHIQTFSLPDPSTVDLSKLRVFTLDRPPLTLTRQCVKDTIAAAATSLEQRGATVKTLKLPKLKYTLEMWSAMLQERQPDGYDVILGDGTRINAGWELLKLPFWKSRYTAPALFLAWGESFTSLFKGRNEKMIAMGKALSDELAEILGDDGVLLYPPYTRAAPRHNLALLTPTDAACTAIFNILLNPVTQVPLGFDKNQLPLGVQVVGAPGQDHLCVAAALAIEKDHGGWVQSQPTGNV
jgi:fatty acid amide hydrolase 2